MSSCIPCGKLTPALSNLNNCYPPSKQLVAAGPDFKPLSQDLSKLIYFAINKPSQLAKIGEELEKRVVKESKGSSGGYAKSRASLLISLAILKALITDCKRDLNLFSRYALRIIVLSLDVKVYQKGGPDLEVIGRAASCFNAFATFTDGGAVGVDDSSTKDYVAALKKFGFMGTISAIVSGGSEKPDTEAQNRSRLIALAALSGASSSDALFLSNSEFARQIDIIIPALLANMFDTTIDHLKVETAKVEVDASPSPYFSEFSARRPVNDRRAPSLHSHIPGEKGPTGSDVVSAAVRSLKALVAQCQVNQASLVLDSVFKFLDRQKWTDVERCCLLAEELTKFTSLQYRFVVPTRLVETLLDCPDGQPTAKQSTLLAMITTILNSSVSLVGLGVADILGNLLTLIVRRIHRHERDSLLPPLVQCVVALGTHIYYADQINDIVEEISLRMAEIPPSDKNRQEILRVLIHCITGVLTVVHQADDRELEVTSPSVSVTADKGKGPLLDGPVPNDNYRRSQTRRNPVAPSVWQETLPLLCEASYGVRSAYARALLLFLERELHRESGVIRPGDLTTARFSNALHAALYTLAMSACLGSGAVSPDALPTTEDSPAVSAHHSPQHDLHPPRLPDSDSDRAVNGEAKEVKVSFNITEPSPGATASATPLPNGTSANAPSPSDHTAALGHGTAGSGSKTPPKKTRRPSRRVSLPLNRLNSVGTLSSYDNVATPLDFAFIIRIMDVLHNAIPTTALGTGAPMLLALDKDAGQELVRRPGDGRQGAWVLERKRAIRECVGFIWRFIAERWGVDAVDVLANKALNALPEPFVVPVVQPLQTNDILPAPEEPMSFMQHMIEGECSTAIQPTIDPDVVVSAFANSEKVQRATSRDAVGVMRRLGIKWTVEGALRDSVERFSSARIEVAPDAHYDVANVLMAIENPSYQSFSRPQSRAVDVGDLRDALGGRTDTISTSGPPSITSVPMSPNGHVGVNGSSITDMGGSPKRMGGAGAVGARKEDVREVLKDIFKDKKKSQGMKKAQVAAPVVNGA